MHLLTHHSAAIGRPLFPINCLWFGGPLGVVEQLSLMSMLRQGHAVRLFSYDRALSVPSGVEVVDAREVMPEDRMFIHHRRKSPAIGADLFRCHLMERDLGLWSDLDVVLLHPLEQTPHHFFGWQDAHSIASGVLYLVSGSPLLRSMLTFLSEPFPVPPFFDPLTRWTLWVRRALGVPKHVREMRWGVTGPRALTYFAQLHGDATLALPPTVLYPVPLSEAHGPLTANWDINRYLTPETRALHLWNTALRHPSAIRPVVPPGAPKIERGSFLGEFARRELGYVVPS